MLPVVALVGRPNVGKSTLFNALTGTSDALVSDVPGLTRDRKYGYGRQSLHRFIVVDTGGLVESPRGIEQLMAQQTQRAIDEADRVVFLVDGQSGIEPSDRFVADVLRKSGKPVTIAVNKCEGRDSEVAVSDFHGLGLGEPQSFSAAHRQGIDELIDHVLAGIAPPAEDAVEDAARATRVCVVGSPECRQVHADQPPAGRGADDCHRPAGHHPRHRSCAIRA